MKGLTALIARVADLSTTLVLNDVDRINIAHALRREIELETMFDLRWNADRRGIERWKGAHPGNISDLKWPDHADMVTWLLRPARRQRTATAFLFATKS